jgi:hypothetical protein
MRKNDLERVGIPPLGGWLPAKAGTPAQFCPVTPRQLAGYRAGGRPAAVQRLLVTLPITLLLCLSLAATAAAQERKPPEFVAVKVGFGDHFKLGVWTPIEVTLHGGSNKATGWVQATAADGDGLNCSFVAPEPCEVLPDQDKTVTLCVRFGRHENTNLRLQFVNENGRTLADKNLDTNQSEPQDQLPDPMHEGDRLIVSVGKTSLRLENAVPNPQGNTPDNVFVTVNNMARLPTRWEGYEGVDYVIISTSNLDAFTTVGPGRIEALSQWVRLGGTLVLCAGSNAELALNPKSPLAQFVPGRFKKTVTSRETGLWEKYVKDSKNQIPPRKPGERPELTVAQLEDVQGKIDLGDKELPLVVRKARGLGQVVFVATDIDRGPIRDWSDRPQLLSTLLDLPPVEPPTDPNAMYNNMNYGYSDLAGQLRSLLDQPRDVKLVPFFVVALLVIAYILLIGPGDYFLLRRLGRGMHWTWITFPAIVLLFSVGSYFAAYWLKGGQLRVNQIDLVDIDSDGWARGASWFSIFSPAGETFDLSMKPRLPDGQSPQEESVSLGWLGKPGKQFNEQAPLWSQGYSIAPSLDAIHGVMVQVWASKSFVQRWLGRAPGLGLKVSLKTDQQDALTGTIVNQLKGNDPEAKNGITLSRCFLVYGTSVYALGTLKPNQQVEIGTNRVELKSYIASAAPDVNNEPQNSSEPGAYDRGGGNVNAVLAMMFYNAADARKYTQLSNDYQRFTDLSGLLKTGCAVLVAMPPQDGSCRGGDLLRGKIPREGQTDSRQPLGNALDRHTTYYRFVLPVTVASDSNNN